MNIITLHLITLHLLLASLVRAARIRSPAMASSLGCNIQTPTTSVLASAILIDQEGRIAATYVGMVDRNGIEQNIQKLLAQK